MHRRDTKERKSSPSFIAGTSVLIGILAIILLLILLSAVTLFVDVPDQLINILSPVILMAGAYIAGKEGGFRSRRKGMSTGAVCGFITVSVLAAVSWYISGKVYIITSIIRILLCILSGIIGGIVGVNKPIVKPPP
ncbi:MAG: TIGR04086 family membrane protein [Oscillospiraceae bacterium]|nr:TIGR04086 family membrane protein [Oscillospiraceae bacterium]